MDKDREKTLFNDLKPWFQILSVKFLAKFSGFNIFCWEFNYPGCLQLPKSLWPTNKRVFLNWLIFIAINNMELSKTLGKEWFGFILSNEMLKSLGKSLFS